MTPPPLGEAIRTESLSWRISVPQVWRDPARGGRERTCRFYGLCVTCGRRTYAFDDGENDPRGILGNRSASPLVAAEYGETGPDMPCCFGCANDEPAYRRALDMAGRRWRNA